MRSPVVAPCEAFPNGKDQARVLATFGVKRLNYVREYHIWADIKRRCLTPHGHAAKWYFGMELHHPWKTDFWSFFQHVGKSPTDKHSIDRIDTRKGYIPGNLRWATKTQQARNQINTVYVKWNGETLPLADLAERHNLLPRIVYGRIKIGWTLEKALAIPRLKKGHPCPPIHDREAITRLTATNYVR